MTKLDIKPTGTPTAWPHTAHSPRPRQNCPNDITKDVYSNTDETFHRIDMTVYEPAAATAALTILGKHMGLFTEKVQVDVKPVEPDFRDPQEKLKLAREILFMIAKAEHGVRNAPKVIEHKPCDKSPLT